MYSKLSLNNPEKFSKTSILGISFILSVGPTIAFFLSAFGYIFIPALFGNNYINSVSPFSYIIWVGILYLRLKTWEALI